MKMTYRYLAVTSLILVMVLAGFSYALARDGTSVVGSGHGWSAQDLVISTKDSKTKGIIETISGKVYLKQSRSKFMVNIAPEESWQIMDLRIYVGSQMPRTGGNQLPNSALFPLRVDFLDPVDSYEHVLDLTDDLGVELEKKATLYVSVFAKMRGIGTRGQTLVEEAWARGSLGEDTFDYVSGGTSWYSLFDTSESEYFRRNVSKNPQFETTKAKIEVLHYYVQARKANRNPVTIEYDTIAAIDEEGNVASVLSEYRNEVKPLVSVYAEEIPDTYYPDIYTGLMTNRASDVFAAVSLDEGQTWKVTNLSRAADRSSFNLGDRSLYPGFPFPGQVKKPNVKQQGNKIMVAWTSKYARSGNPTYSLDETNDYYEEDIWGVGGAQRSKDYTNVEDGFPGIEIPFSVVWTCRGFIEQDGTITWMKPERLTSGRRDAEQVAVASSPTGFAIVWQEDPDGLRPGDGAGPGHGWSGATVNNGTDIWYSYVLMEDFQKIDDLFESGGESGYDPDDPDKGSGRPKALVPMKLPVRISDNEVLNSENMKVDSLLKSCPSGLNPFLDYVNDSDLMVLYKSDYEASLESESAEIGLLGCDGDCGDGGGGGIGIGEGDGSRRYGLELESLLWRYDNNDPYILFLEKTNNQGAIKYVAITADNRLMDGGQGGSRPGIMTQRYQKPDGTYSAWVVLGYEQSKGTGSGSPDREDGDESGCGDDEHEKEPGAGTGSDRYFPDRGKNIAYHSFDFQNPDLVSSGDFINPQQVKLTDGVYELAWLEDENGVLILDWKGDLIPARENARRPRFIIQSKAAAIAGKADNEPGTVMVSVYKMGLDGRGDAADVMLIRWETSRNDKGNPYRFANLATRADFLTGAEVVDWQNMGSVTPIDFTVEYTTKGEPYNRVYSWEQTEGNLYDYTWEEPGINSRAHRGFIRGDYLAIAYVFTPNWRQARNGHDIYNCYIRRSFDGGKTWTTDPKGTGVTHWEIMKDLDGNRYVNETQFGPGVFESARNVSLLKNNEVITIEPRLVGVPGTTLTDGTIKYPQDQQNVNAFWMTYGTEETPGKDYDGAPVNLYYSFTTDRGEIFGNVDWDYLKDDKETMSNGFQVWDWLAKDKRGLAIEQAESQIRMTPDASVFYAIWNEWSIEGSDAIFRRILRGEKVGDIVSIRVQQPTE